MVVGVVSCWEAYFLPALLDDDTQVCSLLTCSFVRVGLCSRVCTERTVPVWAADHDRGQADQYHGWHMAASACPCGRAERCRAPNKRSTLSLM